MIIDSSALVAILMAEPESLAFRKLISDRPGCLVPTPVYLETSMVLIGRKGTDGVDLLDTFLGEAAIEILPFTADHAVAASEAFLRYGKDRHRAALNFGDCMAYAAASVEEMSLLFKGDDFGHTDISPAA